MSVSGFYSTCILAAVADVAHREKTDRKIAAANKADKVTDEEGVQVDEEGIQINEKGIHPVKGALLWRTWVRRGLKPSFSSNFEDR